MQLDDKRIVLTGAASGIGHALLTRLTAYHSQIIAVDINAISTDSLSGGDGRVYPYKCDLSVQAENDDLFDYALETMGGIDLFIANAGFAHFGQAESLNWEQMSRIFQVNVFSPLHSISRMARINTDMPYTVVLVASAMSKLGLPGYAHYSGTKAALDRFAEAYRFEMPSNGHLMVVYPIATRTEFFKSSSASIPIPFPSQTAEYVAGRIINGIKHDKQSVSPSSGFNIFWLLARNFPFIGRLYQRYTAKQLKKSKATH